MTQDRHSETRQFAVAITQEGSWYIAQCLDVDVASQGKSRDEAIENLREALELHFEDPMPTEAPEITRIEMRIVAA